VSRRPWLGLALSLALHAGVVALVLVVVSRDELLPALMVDLRDHFVPGSASVGSSPRAERSAPSAPAPRTKKEKREGSIATRQTLAPPAPAASPPPASVVETPPAPPARPPAPTSESPGEPAPAVSPPPREVVEPRPSGSLATATTGEAPLRAGGGGGAASGGTGETSSGDREMTGDAPAGSDHGTSGPRVASVPPGGGGAGVGAEYGPYLAALRQRIQQSVRYPASARRRGLAGTVSVEILILVNGAIGDVTLLESSSHSVLDEAALETIRSLPRMPLPPELPARALRVRVPVVFQMR
jgi:protein TonB